MTLEEYLILKAESRYLLSLVKIIGIDLYDSSVFLFYSITGKEKKINLSLFTNSLEEAYEKEVWADMLSKGYILIYLDGGWIVKNEVSGNRYELSVDTCTCASSSHKPNIKCKHLMFKDAELRYKAKQGLERFNLYNSFSEVD